jgi:hypothetical protein
MGCLLNLPQAKGILKQKRESCDNMQQMRLATIYSNNLQIFLQAQARVLVPSQPCSLSNVWE